MKHSGCAVQASPIVRVAVEPVRPTDLAQLEEGLKLLNRADPFVEVTTQDSGEHVIGAAGTTLPLKQNKSTTTMRRRRHQETVLKSEQSAQHQKG